MDLVQRHLGGRAAVGKVDAERDRHVTSVNPEIEDSDLQEVAIRLWPTGVIDGASTTEEPRPRDRRAGPR